MELEPMPENLESEVLSAVNETGNRLEENKQILRQWMSFQTHLPSPTYDERILNLFLRGCKHDVEKTKRKLDNYFTFRTVYPDLFANRDPFHKSIQVALESFNTVPLPKLTFDGYRITLHKFTCSNADQFDPQAVFRSMLMIGDIRLVEEPAMAGDIFLFDVQNLTAVHFAKLVNPILKATLHCCQEAYPQRLKEIHLFNAPPMIDRVISFFKQFLKEKMRNRFFVHKGFEGLYNFFPRSHLPQDYGGELKPLQELQGFWIKKLKSYKPYFEQQELVKSDESKRSKCAKSVEETFFGCEGAFRRLNID